MSVELGEHPSSPHPEVPHFEEAINELDRQYKVFTAACTLYSKRPTRSNSTKFADTTNALTSAMYDCLFAATTHPEMSEDEKMTVIAHLLTEDDTRHVLLFKKCAPKAHIHESPQTRENLKQTVKIIFDEATTEAEDEKEFPHIVVGQLMGELVYHLVQRH